MANNDKQKFQLKKGTNHGFDISKGGKRNFDLSKEDDEEPIVVTPSASSDTDSQSDNGSKKWLWIIAAIIAVVLLVWWLIPGADSTANTESENEVPVENTIPIDSTIAEPIDTVPASVEEAPIEEDAVSEVSEQAKPAPEVPSQSTPVNDPTGDIESEAMKVIRGDYGIGQERKERLGSRYSAIQARVNELKREGAF